VSNAYLVSENDTQGHRRIPIDGRITIGRALGCDLVIDDPAASRQHIAVIADNEGFRWEDLKSTNGTLFNGVPKPGGDIEHGDRLYIGDTVLRFELEQAPQVGSAVDRSSFFKRAILDGKKRDTRPEDAFKTEKLLYALYTVVNEIASDYDPCSLVDRILQTCMRAISAQRGAVLFAQPEGTDLLPCPVCKRVHTIQDGELRLSDSGEIRISSTVARRVLQDGETVLYRDTGQEGGIERAESVQALNLRSIICVPLRGKQSIQGILYVDTNRPDHLYEQEDLLLTTAVGNSAGLALENAQMHQHMLEKQRIDQEIAFAWNIQEGFLVRDWPEEDPRFKVFGCTLPAKTVGGDFYDFVQPAPNLIGMLIGDVSGKGVPAALTMAQLLAEFRVRARESTSPADVISQLNHDLSKRSRRGLFCSLCYITLDLESGKAVCANAGHHPPLRIAGRTATPFAAATGPPIGVVEGGAWENADIQLSPGESILLYTDGITEARAPDAEYKTGEPSPEYGEDRLSHVVIQCHDGGPQALIDAILGDVRRYTAPKPPHDDCTMIALRFRP
jgi:phosphoserine phosphatase RsbU/P